MAAAYVNHKLEADASKGHVRGCADRLADGLASLDRGIARGAEREPKVESVAGVRCGLPETFADLVHAAPISPTAPGMTERRSSRQDAADAASSSLPNGSPWYSVSGLLQTFKPPLRLSARFAPDVDMIYATSGSPRG